MCDTHLLPQQRTCRTQLERVAPRNDMGRPILIVAFTRVGARSTMDIHDRSREGVGLGDGVRKGRKWRAR